MGNPNTHILHNHGTDPRNQPPSGLEKIVVLELQLDLGGTMDPADTATGTPIFD